MSRPVAHFLFDPQYPEIVVTSATPRGATFSNVGGPLRRSRSQEPGFLRVPKREVGDARARDPKASQRSLRRSPSMPAVAQFVHVTELEKTQKYAAKAPWALEGKAPVRLDLSLWKSKKSKLQTEVFNVVDVPVKIELNPPTKSAPVPGVNVADHIGHTSRSTDDHAPKQKGPPRRPDPPELPTVLIEVGRTPKARTGSFGNGKRDRGPRSLEDGMYGDAEVTRGGAARSATAYQKGGVDEEN